MKTTWALELNIDEKVSKTHYNIRFPCENVKSWVPPLCFCNVKVMIHLIYVIDRDSYGFDLELTELITP